MPVRITQEGDWKRIEKFLKNASKRDLHSILEVYGKQGVDALSAATPRDTGKTADSWYYTTEITKRGVSITWRNKNLNDGVPIVLLIEYGHGFQNGTYVEGKHFIGESIKPTFDKLAREAWKEVCGK